MIFQHVKHLMLGLKPGPWSKGQFCSPRSYFAICGSYLCTCSKGRNSRFMTKLTRLHHWDPSSLQSFQTFPITRFPPHPCLSGKKMELWFHYSTLYFFPLGRRRGRVKNGRKNQKVNHGYCLCVLSVRGPLNQRYFCWCLRYLPGCERAFSTMTIKSRTEHI